MNRDVYLVNVARLVNQVQFPIWMSVLTNSLKLHNFFPILIDLIPIEVEQREKKFKSLISDKPAIYGFSIIAGNQHLDETVRYVKILKEANPDNIIVYGGPLPSAIPELMFEHCSCDYIVVGEGEFTFPKLIYAINENKEPIDIDGVFYKKDGKLIGRRSKRIQCLDEYSNMDFSFFDMDYYIGYLKETDQSFEIMATRGCKGRCSFCFKFAGAGLSKRNIKMQLDEIEYILKTYNMNKIYFVDENIIDSKEYFLEFIKEKNRRNLDFGYFGQARLDSVDEEILEIGKKSGLLGLTSGIESSSQSTLKLINKETNINDIEKKIELIRSYDVKVFGSFIVGFEWDTDESLQELEEFIIKNKFHNSAKVHYLTPLPGTKLFKDAVNKGYIKNEFEYIRNLGDLYWDRMVNMTILSNEKLDYYYNRLSNICSKKVNIPVSEIYLRTIRKIH